MGQKGRRACPMPFWHGHGRPHARSHVEILSYASVSSSTHHHHCSTRNVPIEADGPQFPFAWGYSFLITDGPPTLKNMWPRVVWQVMYEVATPLLLYQGWAPESDGGKSSCTATKHHSNDRGWNIVGHLSLLRLLSLWLLSNVRGNGQIPPKTYLHQRESPSDEDTQRQLSSVHMCPITHATKQPKRQALWG